LRENQKTPDASTFWRIIDEHKVNAMFTAPTAIRAIKKRGSRRLFYKKYDLSSLKFSFSWRTIYCNLEWYKHIPIPAIDHWWQTIPHNDCYNDGVFFLSNPDLLEKLFVAIILKYLMKKESS
jgi:acyl-coenzyme A synthetase/AMP-(fatty) acid ligase